MLAELVNGATENMKVYEKFVGVWTCANEPSFTGVVILSILRTDLNEEW